MFMRVTTTVCRQALLKSNVISKEIVTYRRIHVIAQGKRTLRSNILLDLHRNCRVTGVSSIRYASTDETPPQSGPHSETPEASTPVQEMLENVVKVQSNGETPLQSSPYDEIPDPPTPLQELMENIVKVHPNGEPTFESLGLGSWYPPGIIQQFLEYLHISFDMPWWLAIVTVTICVRTLIFPMVIKSRRNMVHFTNNMPKIQELQTRITEARNAGDQLESARAVSEMVAFMKKNKISPLTNMLPMVVQAPVFMSCFLALRKMANLPVESLKDGGFWWVKDLTMYDPYYIMPIVTSVTMFITIELGTDGANVHTMGMMRYVIRAVPFVVLPFMIHFPGTILTYWVATNVISLGQAGLLRIPYVKKALKMPDMKVNMSAVKSKKTFIQEFKENYTNMKIAKQLSAREQEDIIQFNSAGKGPLVKTFKFDPTKQKQSPVVLTKSRK
ncbi:PREDICTED: mitochondrial inner membrane protein OXA1L [Vollenhovia emeryi]|uniref:mitochondrial inner membrane protein OXA1L n=1 Tax=Vollenhovia emeryi TaxID=411798 RepID=UPI0005F5572D|nr:PREDICTED: mitochondrial inner membrane protein OXA1L [Vollenhovia emeryi]